MVSERERSFVVLGVNSSLKMEICFSTKACRNTERGRERVKRERGEK